MWNDNDNNNNINDDNIDGEPRKSFWDFLNGIGEDGDSNPSDGKDFKEDRYSQASIGKEEAKSYDTGSQGTQDIYEDNVRSRIYKNEKDGSYRSEARRPNDVHDEQKKKNFEQNNEPKKKKSFWGRVIPGAIAFGAIAGGVFTGVAYAGNRAIQSQNEQIQAQATLQTAQTLDIEQVQSNQVQDSNPQGVQNAAVVQSQSEGGMDVITIAGAVMPCMVELNGKGYIEQSTFFGTQQYETRSSGTGIIVGKNEEELLILTNAHVVEQIEDLQSLFVDGNSVNAVIKGSNTNEDVAVVSVKLSDIPQETMEKIAIAQLDDSDSAVVGQHVIAIGNALGDGQSVTVGYISALNRSITVDNVNYTGLIMTDAAINSGNSGGALINEQGKVIGINFAKDGSYGVENMAYSIPISKVKDLINSMMTQETREQVSESEASYLGITGIDITSDMFLQYGYPQGVMLRHVEEGSPAAQAGLDTYDIITGFDGKSVTTLSGLQGIMRYYKAGETVVIDYSHMEGNQYVEKSVEVTLASKPAQ